ncbi:pseudouridine synthase [Mycoplasmopsis opalescens]|uniref:pseudouridine synthase n=1 Tax=Mycoplasmopsis opalescens TaxID=114886 RepID=UPI0004A6C7BC|nr:pseudouridine synthase [Mycoplasmopsis opalescens]
MENNRKNEPIRIQKIIAHYGCYSRRNAEVLIQKGLIKINGEVAKLGQKCLITDKILIKNKPLEISKDQQKIYFLLNKPAKTVTTAKDEHGRQTVLDLVPREKRLVPVGRLDYNTTGALLLTNDYDLVNKLIHPKYQIIRVYRARLDNPLTNDTLKKLNSGVMVNGKISYQEVVFSNDKSYLVALNVGSYHHVKKIFEAFGHKVINLKRIAFANLTIEKMPLGTYRQLTLKEVKDLKNIVRKQEEQWKND